MSYFWHVLSFIFQFLLPDCVLWWVFHISGFPPLSGDLWLTSMSKALNCWWTQTAGGQAGQLEATLPSELTCLDLFSWELPSYYHLEAFPLCRSDDLEQNLPDSFLGICASADIVRAMFEARDRKISYGCELALSSPFSGSHSPLYPHACPPQYVPSSWKPLFQYL